MSFSSSEKGIHSNSQVPTESPKFNQELVPLTAELKKKFEYACGEYDRLGEKLGTVCGYMAMAALKGQAVTLLATSDSTYKASERDIADSYGKAA